ncbi:FAD/NAD(P)-binding domain-containing protein [Lojkania enalia]|uniref:FAD/NAD(P)-binding domain-containing protein n=1 Tax=Lojkania enalia TaxID=147567 RepID=A0A9P4N3I6_9PLEO|nr:FAD/NAD(P)-binding domain-containing protein [Didymosphaeria enalia]
METDQLCNLPSATAKKLSIIVVGGSLSGLFTTLALRSQGHSMTLLERAPTPLLHDQGAGIIAGGDTLAFFKRYDRVGRPFTVSSRRRQYLDRNGAVVHKEDMVQKMTSWDLVYHILRANVDGVESPYCEVPNKRLRDGDGEVRYLAGHTVTNVLDTNSGKVCVVYKTADGNEGRIEADFVVGADGPSSTVRQIFLPSVQRAYAGYVALRGTVPEDTVSPLTLETFRETFTFFHTREIQILAYLIPGKNGTLEPGKRYINFVYYTNFPSRSLDEPSAELVELMTDVDGVRHRTTMPPGKTHPQAWEKQCQIARQRLPPQFAEIICKTGKPFIQTITDIISPINTFLNGKVVLLGDALAGFRPHTVASTSQAAFDVMLLADMMSGAIDRAEWKTQTMAYARTIQRRGVAMGTRSQWEDLPLHEHIRDRNLASKAREEEVWPDWALQDGV